MARTAILAGLAIVLVASSASAQTRRITIDARVLTGSSIGGGDGQARVRRTPIFVEAGAHTWLSEEANIVIGASMRLELEDRVGFGAVARAGMRADLDALELRPSIAAVAMFAPYTLVGPEVGVILAMHLDDRFAILAQVLADVFVWGTDLPSGTVLTQINGGLGVEIGL